MQVTAAAGQSGQCLSTVNTQRYHSQFTVPTHQPVMTRE